MADHKKDSTAPFADDTLNRTIYWERELAPAIDYLHGKLNPPVLFLDAPWGTGKSWLLKNMERAMHEDDRYTVVRLDASKYDQFPPLQVIAWMLYKMMPEDEAIYGKLRKQINHAIMALGDMLVRKYAGDYMESIERTAQHAGDVFGPLDEMDKAIQAEEELKSALNAICSSIQSEGKRIVFLIDELDRCKPAYALNMLEDLRNYFELDNIMFVFATTSDQLRSMVTREYGDGINANAYLRKFVGYVLEPPALGQSAELDIKFLNSFLESNFQELKQYASPDDLSIFRSILYDGIRMFGLDLREIKKIITSAAIDAHVAELRGEHDGVWQRVAWGMFTRMLKTGDPELFAKIMSGNRNDVMRAADALSTMISQYQQQVPGLHKPEFFEGVVKVISAVSEVSAERTNERGWQNGAHENSREDQFAARLFAPIFNHRLATNDLLITGLRATLNGRQVYEPKMIPDNVINLAARLSSEHAARNDSSHQRRMSDQAHSDGYEARLSSPDDPPPPRRPRP